MHWPSLTRKQTEYSSNTIAIQLDSAVIVRILTVTRRAWVTPGSIQPPSKSVAVAGKGLQPSPEVGS